VCAWQIPLSPYQQSIAVGWDFWWLRYCGKRGIGHAGDGIVIDHGVGVSVGYEVANCQADGHGGGEAGLDHDDVVDSWARVS